MARSVPALAAPAIGGRYAKQSVAYAALHDSDRPAHGFTIAYPAYSPNLKCKTPPSDPNKTANLLQFRHVFICEDFPTPTAQQTNGEYNRVSRVDSRLAQPARRLGARARSLVAVLVFGPSG